MKLKKIISLTLCGALACTSLAACGKENKSSETEKDSMKTIIAKEENVKLLGRTALIDDTLWCAFSGTGIDFDFTGKSLEITIEGDGAAFGGAENQARAAIYVDGERVVDELINEAEKTFKVVDNAESKTVNVKVVKLSETAMSTFGIKPFTIQPGETVKPAAAKAHRIEFIGDSITCGYGVDDEDRDHHFVTGTEDVTKAYAYKTAQALDADYSMVSISGYGIISGYTSNPSKKVPSQTIPQYYDKLGFSYNQFAGTTSPQDMEWDFSKFTPEVVVINLGTNDSSYCQSDSDKQQEYIQGYRKFLETVRAKNPDAEIFCALGIMGQGLCSSIEEMLYYYQKETGDEKVHFFKFDAQDGSLGYAADWHPTEATHTKSAEAFAAEIKSVMGW